MNIGLYISPSHAVPPDERNILAPWVLVKQLANGLVAEGHAVTLFAAKGSKTRARLVHAGITPTVRTKPEYDDSDAYRSFVIAQEMLLFREVIAYAKAGKLDLVHVHQPVERLYPAFAALPPKFPVVITFHDPIRAERFPALEKLYALGNIHFVTLSKSQQRCSLPAGRQAFPFAGVVPNGVDTTVFVPDEMGSAGRRAFSSSAMRRYLSAGPVGSFPPRTPTRGPLLGGPPASVTRTLPVLGGDAETRVPTSARHIVDSRPLLMTGRIVVEKGFTDGIAAAQQAGERLLIVGEEYLETKKNREYFEREVLPMVDKKTVFWESVVKQEHLVGHYQTAKALLFPIQWEEPFGLVMIEAMACGTPVVAYGRGSVPEIVADGKTGYVVDPERGVDGLVSAIGRIGEIDRMACRQHVEQFFSLSTMIKAYERVYARCTYVS